MLNKIGAEFVLFLHFCFVVFAVAGGFLGFVDSRWLWFHVPVVAWSAVVNLFGWTCPLTPLEKMLRSRAGEAGYQHGFITHYIGPVVYPGGMPRQLELTAAFSIVGWNLVVYALVILLRHS
jgi:hypothetical protein